MLTAPYKSQVEIAKSQPQFSTLVEMLRYRVSSQPDKKAFIFLQDGEIESNSLTYGELDKQARAIATRLQSLEASGERALLLYPPGLEFIAAFFGCLYAGVIGVPLYPPKRNQNVLRLQSIVADAGAKLALTTQSIAQNMENHLAETPDLEALHWLTTDNNEENSPQTWQQPTLSKNSLAFLQYTSGSTGTPKGVMVSHQNLLVNSVDVDRGFSHEQDHSAIVTWLPTFHDMGLIYGVLQPIYKGIPCYMMAPVFFVQSPFRWLEAISRYRATHSGAPNFAYDLCTRKITPEQRATLDLSSWKVAFNGAEPIKADSLKRFTQMFEPCGFELSAFSPSYGLAEATLKVTAVRQADCPKFYRVQAEPLKNNQVVSASEEQENAATLVGCGQTEIDTKVLIVNPDSLTPSAPDEVGEIWVSGSTVAQGYWNRLKATQQTFQAYLADSGKGPFLRTGDLGFIQEGELFVTGRLKDAIIIRGRNHYPQDIELTVEQSDIALIPQRSAAFSIEVEGQEKLVIVAEIERRYHDRRQNRTAAEIKEHLRRQSDRRQEHPDPGFEVNLLDLPILETTISNIKQAVSANHGLQVHEVLLLRVGTIPKTSSGKIQRYACRQGFFEGSLTVVYRSDQRR